MEQFKNIKKILFRSPNWIGDAVMALPALEGLKEAYPEAEITVMAKPWVAEVFKESEFVSDIFIYDAKERHRGLFGFFTLIDDLKEKKFDLAFLLTNSLSSAMIAFLANIPLRVGYVRDMRGFLLTNGLPFDRVQAALTHEAMYFQEVLTLVGGESDPKRNPQINITKEEEAKGKKIIKDKGFFDKPLIGVFPGASFGPSKKWYPERYKETLNELCTKYDAYPVIFGGAGDVEAAREIKKDLKLRFLDLSGKVSLREFMAIVKNVKVFISNDSGPMHIAAALGTPTVGIFGSTEPQRTAPLGEKVTVVREKVKCAPCFKRTCIYDTYECLDKITTEMVVKKSDELING